MNKILFYQLLYLQILSFVNSSLYYARTKSYFIFCVYNTYNVPFSPIIGAFLIKLYIFFAHKRKINTMMISIMINNS